jgi:hypothetical protein
VDRLNQDDHLGIREPSAFWVATALPGAITADADHQHRTHRYQVEHRALRVH